MANAVVIPITTPLRCDTELALNDAHALTENLQERMQVIAGLIRAGNPELADALLRDALFVVAEARGALVPVLALRLRLR